MMKSGGTKGSSNTVMNDRQWIRRVKQEEINMIDSFSGPKANQIEQARATQQKNHFYPTHSRMTNNTGAAAAAMRSRAPEETKSYASSVARDSDGLDSVSQVSVQTPKSRTVGNSSRHGDSVSYTSQLTTSTTVSTKKKMQDLERQLNEEREMRIQMEKRIAALQNK